MIDQKYDEVRSKIYKYYIFRNYIYSSNCLTFCPWKKL